MQGSKSTKSWFVQLRTILVALALIIGVGVTIVATATGPAAASDTDTYPWPSAPCEWSKADTHCIDPAHVGDFAYAYNWYRDEDGDNGFTGNACDAAAPSAECFDNFGYQYRNCTSFVAQKISQVFSKDIHGWGNAANWAVAAQNAGYTWDPTPRVGDIAQWNTSPGGGSFGHVAYVYAVDANGVASLDEYNAGTTGDFSSNRTTAAGSAGPADHYIHIGDIGGSASTGATSSTEDAQYGGDFNGDGYGDVVMFHRASDGGADIHLLYGQSGSLMFSAQYGSFIRHLAFLDGWDWTKMKLVAGRFNSDNLADVAILFRLPDNSIDVHILYGGMPIFSSSYMTFIRRLSNTAGWDWTKIKVVSGDFNADGYDDILMAHQLSDGGADMHVLYGGIGPAMFTNSTTFVRRLAGTDGWNWSQMKLAAGMFNADGAADLAIVHRLGDGGMDVHMLQGGLTPFTNATTFVRRLAAASGWNWDKVKLAAGPFNSDNYGDVAILHQVSSGIDVHVLYGGPTPFPVLGTTLVRHLDTADGWNWSTIKMAAGQFQADTYGDLAILQQLPDDGVTVGVLYGQVGSLMFSAAFGTVVRTLDHGSGWSWSVIKVNSSS